MIVISTTRSFFGGRHDRTYAIWEEFLRRQGPGVEHHWIPAQGGHLQSLRFWGSNIVTPSDHDLHVFVENDFLPEPTFAVQLAMRLQDSPLVAPEARHRRSSWEEPMDSGIAGGWFVALDRRKVPSDLDFKGGPPFRDPGNNLQIDVPDLLMLRGEFQDPGIYYPGLGYHCFWSRAWDGDMSTFPNGFDGDFILAQTDRRIAEYEALYDLP